MIRIAPLVVMLAPGTYRLEAPLVIERSDVTLSSEWTLGDCTTSNACAHIIATAGFTAPSLIQIGKTQSLSNVVLDHLVIDGNGQSRRADPGALAECAAGGGRTIMEYGGTNIQLTNSIVTNAMCGTAIGWSVGRTGVGSKIQNNTITNNGADYRESSNLWSDGLTIGAVTDASVIGNVFQDNTDVDLILGGATGNSRIQNNV